MTLSVQLLTIMELLDATLSKLDIIGTAALKSGEIQEILLALKKTEKSEELTEYRDQILEKLWFHLTSELPEFDDQLLCCISFFTALNRSVKEEFYLKQVLQIVQNELKPESDTSKLSRTSLAMSLCYGLFQSSYITQRLAIPIQPLAELFETTVEAVFQLLIEEAYRYTQYTFIVFKILTLLEKINSTALHAVLMKQNNKIKLLNLINHNWENPINGIRNSNRILFRNLLLFLNNDDKATFKLILDEINNFYWNKAKYLMLAEIVEQSNESIEDIMLKTDWLNGLVYSLSKPGLVSAGADMYNAILKRTNSKTVWFELFFNKLMEAFDTCNKVIQNFSNYWCLNTLKKFPSLSEMLIKAIYHYMCNSEQKLYIIMSIMKQTQKLGVLKHINNIKEINYASNDIWGNNYPELFSLEHSNVSIRILAFEIICLHQEKSFPSEMVYEYILKFVIDNVNSDCTVLRISMINSLSIFLTKLLTLFLNTTQEISLEHHEKDIKNLVMFCQNLQDFVVESLDLNGNYQRKITSVKIAYTILKCLGEVPRKKREQISKIHHSNGNFCLIDFLKKNGSWKINNNDFITTLINLLKDPAKDVNESALQLLSEYYSEELSEPLKIGLLTEEGLKCIASKFFYEISCGQVIFKLITQILLRKNKKVECMFKSIEDIFNFAYNEISLEHNSKRDIIQSIENGKQLHSFLSILSLVLEASIKNDYNMNIAKDTINSLLDIVEHVSNQFVWEENLSTSSDFSKISEMVQTMISTSGIEINKEEDNTQISGLYQIVLNCLWLNVKASCELASLLVQCFKHDKTVCERCLNIIVNVLETSRHKGAIEAAGATLGNAIQFLTSLEKELEVSQLPYYLLTKKLKELLVETTRMSSVTRRGAGLSIMVHRIVSNDLQKGKPLFHYFVKTLLNTCKNVDSYVNDGLNDIDNEKDLPKAIYIHLLTRIVTDSSLASHTLYYSAELAALAFDNLSDNHWQIRNAALQLYGALLPKLIGQKKASGTDEETVATVGCDEFRTHFPKLWNYILQQIQNKNHKDVLQAHSNLVPILNVLASLARRYNFSYDLKKQETWDSNLLPHFISLLGSPIYTVRRLTAQCVINIYSFKTIYEELSKLNNCVTENHLHGSLMLLSNSYKVCGSPESMKLEGLTRKYQNIITKKDTSYISKWSLEKLLQETEEVNIKSIQDILLKMDSNKNKPGISLWANLKIKKHLENLSWSMIPEILGLLLKSQQFEVHSETIMNRIGSTDVPKDVLVKIVQILLISDQITKSSELWRVIYHISHRVDLDPKLNIDISPYIKNISYKLRYSIPFIARLLVKQKDNENLLLLSQSIFSLCSPENDVDMRSIAVLGNNEFGNDWTSFSDDVIVNVIKSAVILLQDEDEDIRNLSVNFYKIVAKESKHPFICLNKMLSHAFLYKLFKEPESSIQRICNELLIYIDSLCISKDNEYNPFSNDSKNIYLETNFLRQALYKINKTN